MRFPFPDALENFENVFAASIPFLNAILTNALGVSNAAASVK